MKSILFISIALISGSALAKEQLTIRECKNINKKLEEIRSEMRGGYNIQRGEYLKDKKKKLSDKKYYQCQKPKKD